MTTLYISILVFILVLYFGSKLGGVGIAYAAGIGLFFITLIVGIPPGNIPVNVIFIIIPVIGAIAALELAGGLDYMVYIADKILRSQPKYINILAPVLTFFLTVLVGTGHAAYSLMPVIVEVAQKNNIKPVNSLSTAAIASQVGITSSPISAAIVAFSGLVSNYYPNITLVKVLMITLPSSLLAVIIVGVIQSFRKQSLYKDQYTLDLLKNEEMSKKGIGGGNSVANYSNKVIKKEAKISVILFLCAILSIVIFSSFPSLKPNYSNGTKISNAEIIMIVMLSISFIIIKFSKSSVHSIVNQKTFKAGITATICIIGLAWLGDTLISYYKSDINLLAKNVLGFYPWLFSVVLFIVAMFLYSQVTTVTAIMPLAFALSLPITTIIASVIAVNALFVIPTYPTVVAATQIDYTGTTKIGKYILNHSFLFPGVLMIIIAITLGYMIANIML